MMIKPSTMGKQMGELPSWPIYCSHALIFIVLVRSHDVTSVSNCSLTPNKGCLLKAWGSS